MEVRGVRNRVWDRIGSQSVTAAGFEMILVKGAGLWFKQWSCEKQKRSRALPSASDPWIQAWQSNVPYGESRLC